MKYILKLILAFSTFLSVAGLAGALEPVSLTITFRESPEQIKAAYMSHFTPQVRQAFEKLRPDHPAIIKLSLKINERYDRFGQVYMCVRADAAGNHPPSEYRFSPEGKLWAIMEVLDPSKVPAPVAAIFATMKITGNVAWKWTINGVSHYEAHFDGLEETGMVAPDGTYLGQRFSGIWADPQ